MVKSRRAPIVVERATILEWPQIEALRIAYFTARDQSVQRRPPQAVWWVARIGEHVIGCCSTYEVPELEQRWALDFYRVPGRDGTDAVFAMYTALFTAADDDDLDLLCTVDPANEPQLRAVTGRGFEPVGVTCLRPRRSRR